MMSVDLKEWNTPLIFNEEIDDIMTIKANERFIGYAKDNHLIGLIDGDTGIILTTLKDYRNKLNELNDQLELTKTKLAIRDKILADNVVGLLCNLLEDNTKQKQLINDLKIDLRSALSSEGSTKTIRRCDEKYDLDYDNWWNNISDKLKEE